MSQAHYDIPSQYTIPHGRGLHYASVNTHDAEVLRKRAISPEVAASRRYRTISATEAREYGFRNAGLLIPSINTQGEIERYQLRPHIAPIDRETGKARKYLWPTGSRQSLDVPPASLDLLPSIDVPIIITESAPKADAVVSALITDGIGRYCVIAIAGVYGWRSNGMPLSDFGDIVWRHKERERITARRTVYIAFDSDALTNANVAHARWELSQFLRRKGARVLYLDVPIAADGGKQGIDDALASDHPLNSMIESAYPAPDVPPAANVAPPNADDLPEVARLRQENAYLKQKNTYLDRENGYLVRLSKSPYLPGTDRAMIVNIGTQALAKVSRGELEPDGRVRLTPAEISEDYRPKPEAGEARMKNNPNGDPFLMTRGSVKGRAEAAKAAGLLSFELKATRRERRNGRPYVDHDLLITPPVSLAEFLRPAAMYVPDELRFRADYGTQKPCPACGEVHERTIKTTRRTYCGSENDPGCGAQIGEKETTVTLLLPPANRPEITEEQWDRLERQTAAEPDRNQAQAGTVTKNAPIDSVSKVSPSSPPSNYVGAKNVAVESPAAEPDTMIKTVPADVWKHSTADADVLNVCVCGLPIPSGRKWTCADNCNGQLEVSA